jgi:hypothetical protein
VVKWRLFRSPDDPETQNLYLWHIAHRRNSGFVDSTKDSISVFIPQAKALLASMATIGFDRNHAIPVDANGDILGGAHRTACALSLGINAIAERRAETAWAPAWDASWFKKHGMPEEIVGELLTDYHRLTEGMN